MRMSSILTEDTLFESTLLTEDKIIFNEWRNASKILAEANLTVDQITDLFTNIEGGTAGQKTVAGKVAGGVGKAAVAVASGAGKAASAVGQAYQGLLDKVSNLGPVKSFDDKADAVFSKLKDATGGDKGVAQYVYKYRDFAKKHPIVQNLIYGALVAAVGLATGGAGAPAALGLFKATDRLLQGDKVSQAIMKGGTTAAAAYGAQAIKGAFNSPQTQPGVLRGATTNMSDIDGSSGGSTTMPVQNPNDAFGGAGNALSPDQQAGMLGRGVGTVHQVTNADSKGIWGILQKMGIDPKDNWKEKLDAVVKANAKQYPGLLKNPNLIKPGMNLVIPKTLMQDKWSDGYQPKGSAKLSEHIDKDGTIAAWVLSEELKRMNSVVLREGAVDSIFGAIEEAGFMDTIRKFGKNVTQKYTTDKLMKAWGNGPGHSYSGKPRGADSAVVYAFLKKQGVDDATIASAFSSKGIPVPTAGAAPQAAAQPAQGAAQAAAPSNQAKVQAATKAQQQTQQGLNDYVRNVAASLNKAPPNQKFALTKELVNFMADRQNYPEWNNAVQSVQAVLKGAKLEPGFAANAIQRVKTGQHMEAWQINAINALLEAVGITWKQLGYTVLEENDNSFYLYDTELLNEASSPAQQAAIAINMKKRGKKPKHDESVMEADKTDTVSMDIPLLLRMMEYAREDAKTDEDLHDVAEKMIALSKNHDYLCMDNYNEIVGSAAHDDMNESEIYEMATLLEALALRQVMISEGRLDEAGVWSNIKSAVGKGISGVKTANDAVNRLGQLAQNTTPVQNFDSRVETILQNIANKNPKTAEVARKYGEWAKKHPVKQGLIIGMLTAIASLVGGPAGGAAAGYILRAGNELLKGEKASTAIGKGLKTAAIGGLAGMGLQQIANVMGHVPTHWSEIPGYKEIGSWQVQGDNGINFDVKLPAEQYPKVKKIWDMAQDAYAQGNAEKGNELSSYLTKYFNSPEYTNMLRDIKVKNIDLYQQSVAGAQRVQSIMSGIIAAAQGAVAGGGAARKTESVNEAAKKKRPKPTNPALWSRAKAAARAKYDVYPSAYANGYAAKWYKEHGGGWRGK